MKYALIRVIYMSVCFGKKKISIFTTPKIAAMYKTRTPPLAYMWVDYDYSNCSVPKYAVVGGREYNHGEQVYVARAVHNGDTIPGKFLASLQTCYIPYQSIEHHHYQYQILTNPNESKLAWVPVSNGVIPLGAINGGEQKDGTALFIGRTIHHNGSHAVGKVHSVDKVLYYPYGDREHTVRSYDVLVLTCI